MISRFDALSLAPCSGGAITTWVSGFGTNIATEGNGPTCVASIFGSSPGVWFQTANSNYFTLSNPITAVQSGNMTVMAVWKATAVTQKNTITANNNSAGSFSYILPAAGGVQELDSGQAALLGTGTAAIVVNAIYQSNVSYTTIAAPTFRLNKAVDATQSGATAAITATTNALGNERGGEYPNIYLGALYFFSPALSTANIEAWEATLSCKYPGS